MIVRKKGYFMETTQIVDFWKSTAMKISMEHGVYVKVERRYFGDISSNSDEEICFMVNEHKFGSLRDLRKALRQKAFL